MKPATKADRERVARFVRRYGDGHDYKDALARVIAAHDKERS